MPLISLYPGLYPWLSAGLTFTVSLYAKLLSKMRRFYLGWLTGEAASTDPHNTLVLFGDIHEFGGSQHSTKDYCNTCHTNWTHIRLFAISIWLCFHPPKCTEINPQMLKMYCTVMDFQCASILKVFKCWPLLKRGVVKSPDFIMEFGGTRWTVRSTS